MKRTILFIALFGLLFSIGLACCGGDSGDGRGRGKGKGDSCGCSGDSCGDGGSCCGGGMGMDMGMDGLMTMRNNLKAYWEDVRGDFTKKEGKVRKYYIRADEVIWNYAPLGFNRVTGNPFTEFEQRYTERVAPFLGPEYIKCIYQEYTDGTFKKLKKRPAEEAYMGFLGPTIRGEVGDTIKIKFRNACKFPNSMHPHGVFYNKDSEGAPYADGTSGRDKADDAVPPGGEVTYHWFCPKRAGPASMDGSSAMWMYHSHTDKVVDIHAGLLGFMVITAKGMANKDATPFDVDQEIFYSYQISDEADSHYYQDNIDKFKTTPVAPVTDAAFTGSQQKHAINGYLFANGPFAKMKKNSRIRIYFMSMDLHTPHMHGNTFVTDGMRMDIFGFLHAEMKVVDMVPDNKGLWLKHCHVPFHFQTGMITMYEVVDNKDDY